MTLNELHCATIHGGLKIDSAREAWCAKYKRELLGDFYYYRCQCASIHNK